jgi:type IV pilus assembly protein PilQ
MNKELKTLNIIEPYGRGLMKKGFFRALAVCLLFITTTNAAELSAINFQQKGEISELEMLLDDNNVEATKFHVTEDKQIIIDLKNVTSTDRVMRAFDTSEFSGSIVFVKAYKKPDTKNDIRIALQLRDNVRSVLKRKPNRLVLEIENRFGVFTQSEIKKEQTFEEKVSDLHEEAGKLNIPRSDSIEDILENLTLSGRKKYIGKRITLDITSLAVSDVLKMIADASGFNIIQTEEVQKLKPLTLNLTNVAWDQALDTILGLNNLVAKKSGIILTITTLKEEKADKELQASLRQLKVKEEPLVAKIFPISYANIKDLKEVLNEYLTEGRGGISLDNRTNSIIVKDTVDTIEKIRKIIGYLDTQTPQVLIESKIVEVNETYKKSIGLEEGLKFGYDPVGSLGDATPSIIGDELVTGADGGPGFSFSSAPNDAGNNFFGLSIARFNRLLNLDFKLQLMEFESKGKIVASPKVVAQNKEKAKIETVNTKNFILTTSSGTDGAVTTEAKEVEATLSLEVTPQVTNEGSISLEIALVKEHFTSSSSTVTIPDKFARKLNTSVLIENGSTIVLGGVYNFEKSSAHSGVPFLKDIPLVGWLFRTPDAHTTEKQELIIFMTPRIINQEEAGIVDNT